MMCFGSLRGAGGPLLIRAPQNVCAFSPEILNFTGNRQMQNSGKVIHVTLIFLVDLNKIIES